ncbi:MAG: DNA-3-methyladenine glycosylase, partial [Mycobacteriaceae bacterium]
MTSAVLPEQWFLPPALDRAPLMLGLVLRHKDVALRITEVEAYMGEQDPGSHAYRGRTKRNAVM